MSSTDTFGRGGNDIIQGSTDDDLLFGGGGSDILEGDRGDDTLIDDDTAGTDTIQPGRGINIIYAADGAKTTIDCEQTATGGSSDDIVYADPGDTATHCGQVFRA